MEKFMVALKKKFPDAREIVQSAADEFHVRVGDEYYEETYYYALRGTQLIRTGTLTVDAT